MEKAKLVVEGAGAVGVAALLGGAGRAARASGTTCVVLSGGNVDAGLLATVARRHETEAGPAAGAADARAGPARARWRGCWTAWATTGANLVEVAHVREGIDLHVRETGVQLVIETRGARARRSGARGAHAAGFDVRVVR